MKTSLILLFIFTITLLSCSNEMKTEDLLPFEKNGVQLINPSPSINSTEIELLKYMREEEKLARDVYTYMYEKYGLNVFYNISQSEQNHMNSLLSLLVYYKIDDPASTIKGVFTNQTLQTLYNSLITQGDQSLIEALKAGATIEDLDIYDLMNGLEETKNPAILNILDNLTCGSRNHMRAFVSNLDTQSVTYAPQYISLGLFNSIIENTNERCGQNNGQGNKGKGISKNCNSKNGNIGRCNSRNCHM